MAADGKARFPKQKVEKGKASTHPNLIPLRKNIAKTKKDKNDKDRAKKKIPTKPADDSKPLFLSTSQQLQFFLDCFQSAIGIKFSSLELEAYEDACIVELSQDLKQDAGNLGKHLKATFGLSWKVLYGGKLPEGEVIEGSPAVLVISSSALRSLELLRGLRTLGRDCRVMKLFAKHMKVEDQVALLKGHVDIACGTPSRIKKLIDIDALRLTQLAVVVLDMHTDAKGYSLFTLPQVRDEFWDLFKSHFHQQLLQGNLRLCFYGGFAGIDFKNRIPSTK